MQCEIKKKKPHICAKPHGSALTKWLKLPVAFSCLLLMQSWELITEEDQTDSSPTSLPGPSSVQPTPVTQEFTEDLNLRLSLSPDSNGELPGPSSALVRFENVLTNSILLLTTYLLSLLFFYTEPALQQTALLQYDRWRQ